MREKSPESPDQCPAETRLSDLLRSAAGLPQTFGSYADLRGGDENLVERYCACGAVAHLAWDMDADAIIAGPTARSGPAIETLFEETWPAAGEVRCPLGHCDPGHPAWFTVHGLLVHLNDHHELSFAEMSEHVRRLEDEGVIPVAGTACGTPHKEG